MYYSSSFPLVLSKYPSCIWVVRSILDLNCEVRPMKRQERAIAVQMARKFEIPISLMFPRLEVTFCIMLDFPALGRNSTLTAITTVRREGRFPSAGPHSGHLRSLFFNCAWLGRVEELLETLGLMHYWEKQRNDGTSLIDVCITIGMFFGFNNRRVFSEHIFPLHLDHTLLNPAILFT